MNHDQVTIFQPSELFAAGAVRIIVRDAHRRWLRQDHTMPPHVALVWEEPVEPGVDRSDVPATSSEFPGYLFPEQYLPALRDAITRHLGESDQVAGLRADVDMWKREAEDADQKGRQALADRDVARAQVVGLERTLEAREAHLRHLEALVMPRHFIPGVTPTEAPEDWTPGPLMAMQDRINQAYENLAQAVPDKFGSQTVGAWREGLTPTSPDLADEGSTVVTQLADARATIDTLERQVEALTNRLAVRTHTKAQQGGDPPHCVECSEAAQEWVEWPCVGAAALASSTPGEEPVDNGSGDQAGDGRNAETWTTTNLDVWAHYPKVRRWMVVRCPHDHVHEGAVLSYDPDEAVTPEALAQAADDYTLETR